MVLKLHRYQKVEKKYPIGIISLILSILFFVTSIVITFVIFFVQWNYASLSCKVLSVSNLVDIHDDSTNWEVFYKGKSVREAGGGASLVAIRIINDGTTAIKEGDFQSTAPLTFTFDNCHIPEVPTVMYTTNKSLTKISFVSLEGSNQIVFSPIVMNAGDYIDLSVIVLKENDSSQGLSIKSSGAIAYINDVPVLNEYQAVPSESFWKRVLAGSQEVQIIRFLIYNLGFLLPMWFIVRSKTFVNLNQYIEEMVQLRFSKVMTKKLFDRYRKTVGYTHSAWEDWLYSLCEQYGVGFLWIIDSILLDKERLAKAELYVKEIEEGTIEQSHDSVSDMDAIAYRLLKSALDEGATVEELQSLVRKVTDSEISNF